MSFNGYAKTSAEFTDGRRYRVHLGRWWDQDAPELLWVMLNPSTAGANEDDPTIRRCVGFSKGWGYGGLQVVNLFGLVATNPRELLTAEDPVGLDNRPRVGKALRSAKAAVAGWGATIDKIPLAEPERDHFLTVAENLSVPVFHLGLTKGGHPRHPLYLAANTRLELI